MSDQEKIEIFMEVPPSKDGAYQRMDKQGRTVAGDASGEWVLGEDGEVEDIVFFVSPSWLRKRQG